MDLIKLLIALRLALLVATSSWAAAPPGVTLGFRSITDMQAYTVRAGQTNLIATVPGQGTFRFAPNGGPADSRSTFSATGVTGVWERLPLTVFGGGTGVTNLVQSATGTPDGTKFMRDDWSWQTIPSSGGTFSGMPTITNIAALVADATTNTTYYVRGYFTDGDGGQGPFNKKTAAAMRFSTNRTVTVAPGGGGDGYAMAPSTIVHLHRPATLTVAQPGAGYKTGAATMVVGSDSLAVNIDTVTSDGAISTLSYTSGEFVTWDNVTEPHTDDTPFAIQQVNTTEHLNGVGWTVPADWSGTWAGGFTHTPGATGTLSHPDAAKVGVPYIVNITMSAWTAGTFRMTFGGKTSFLYDSYYAVAYGTTQVRWRVTAATTDSFTIIPSSAFDGATMAITVTPCASGGAAKIATITTPSNYKNGAATVGTIGVTLTTSAGNITAITYASGTTNTSDLSTTIDVVQNPGADGINPGANGIARITGYTALSRTLSNTGAVGTDGKVAVKSVNAGAVTGVEFQYGGLYSDMPGTVVDAYQRDVALQAVGGEAPATIRAYAYGFGGKYIRIDDTHYWEREDSPVIWATAFGCTPNGGADDTIPLQAAVDYAFGGNVGMSTSAQYGRQLVLPSGTLDITNTIKIGSFSPNTSIEIVGQGMASSIIKTTSKDLVMMAIGSGGVVWGTDYPVYYSTLRDFGLCGASDGRTDAANHSIGLQIRSFNHGTIRGLLAMNLGTGYDYNDWSTGAGEYSELWAVYCDKGGVGFNHAYTRFNANVRSCNYGWIGNLSENDGWFSIESCSGVSLWTPYAGHSRVRAHLEQVGADTGNLNLRYYGTNMIVGMDTNFVQRPDWVKNVTYEGSSFGRNASPNVMIYGGTGVKFYNCRNAVGNWTDGVYTTGSSTNYSTWGLAEQTANNLSTVEWFPWVPPVDNSQGMSRAINLFPDGQCDLGSARWCVTSNLSNMTLTYPMTGRGGSKCLRLESSATTGNPYAELTLSSYAIGRLTGRDVVWSCWMYIPANVVARHPKIRLRLYDGTSYRYVTDASYTVPSTYHEGWNFLYCLKPITWGSSGVMRFDFNNAGTVNVDSGMYVLIDDIVVQRWPGDIDKTANGMWQDRGTSDGESVEGDVIIRGGSVPQAALTVGPVPQGTNAVVINGGVQTNASVPALTVSQTLNNSGINYSTFVVNQTNIASGGSTTIAEFMSGGVSKCTISKFGDIVTIGGAIVSGLYVRVANGNDIYWNGSSRMSAPEDCGWRLNNQGNTATRHRICGTRKTLVPGATNLVWTLGLVSTNTEFGGTLNYTLRAINTGTTNTVQSLRGQLLIAGVAQLVGSVTNFYVDLTDYVSAAPAQSRGTDALAGTWSYYQKDWRTVGLVYTPTNTLGDGTVSAMTLMSTMAADDEQVCTPQ